MPHISTVMHTQTHFSSYWTCSHTEIQRCFFHISAELIYLIHVWLSSATRLSHYVSTFCPEKKKKSYVFSPFLPSSLFLSFSLFFFSFIVLWLLTHFSPFPLSMKSVSLLIAACFVWSFCLVRGQSKICDFFFRRVYFWMYEWNFNVFIWHGELKFR